MSEPNFGMGSVSEMMRPFGAFTEMQRQSLEQTRQATHDGFEMQKRLIHAAIDGVESQQSAQEQNSEFTRNSVESAVEAMETSMEGMDQVTSGMDEMVTEQFDAMDEMSDQTWDTFQDTMEENVDAYEAFIDQYASFFDTTFEMYIESLSEMTTDESPHDTE